MLHFNMAFRMLDGFVIILFTISLKDEVLANSCENDNCKAAIDIPLITKLNAPLKAELDISGLTTQLKVLIQNEVEKAVSVAMKDLAENIVDKRTQSALKILQTNNNRTITSFIQELDDESMKTTNRLTELEVIIETNNEKIAQQMKNQIKADSKILSIESEVTKTSEKVAITAILSRSGKINSRAVLKFDVVVFSIGINNLPTFKSTGKFVCEQNGLYMMSVSIASDTNGAIFHIYLNGNSISSTNIATHRGWWHTATAVVAVQLKIADRLWVQTNGINVREIYSDLTIMKVK